MTDVFVDTNILAYWFDKREPTKQAAARTLLSSTAHRLVVNTQVLLEFYAVTTRKLSLPHDEADSAVAALTRMRVVPTDSRLVRRAIATAGSHQLSIWDAMIVEAAVEAGCTEIWTEDLAIGSRPRGVEIVDPFSSI